ncbi:MFS transporter [Kocuria rosea]|uniref:MFS transporter n=1 Tax=Kocuria rosea TaxID=1275 RepID=UPI000DFED441|nr:MFS transporter [Kocuria rosea]STX05708.1 Proline porter II [Kocuria rosea]
MHTSPHALSGTSRRKAVLGASVGHLIEWYDYGVYGFLAIYIGQAFFASEDPMTRLMASFGAFAISFFVRPLGGLVFGPLADKVGRRGTLITVLTLMSASTFAIGLLPTQASVGLLAPLLLIVLRVIQGFSAGGEGGSVTSFLAEYAAPGRRGLSLSYLMVTGIGGMLLGSIVVNGLASSVGPDAMQAWGWRIPFLLAGPLGAVALFIRLRLEDTPEFLALQREGEVSKAPLKDVFEYKRALIIIFCTAALHGSAFYLVLVYANSFLSVFLGYSASRIFVYVLIAGLIAMIAAPTFGNLSDKIGRQKVLALGAVGFLLTTYPFFIAAEAGSAVMVTVTYFLLALFFGVYVSSTIGLQADVFPARVRATGVSVSYSLAQAVFGGSAPLIATYLIDRTGDLKAPAVFFTATAVVSLVAVLSLRPRDHVDSDSNQDRSVDQVVNL